ncbi:MULTISPECIES: hypothetical protein [Paracoccus]|uniref:Uncharacterized protein n=1 Tax=Paracoccus kondratievae TaxID=135740 RepID=A0AAD3RV61_9RHOB|nr:MULTISPECIES: hypothetical protein [Paracoccus]GLK66298.1 hypothetical protein GCM10017635_37750 [Paracoccus kondratievae]
MTRISVLTVSEAARIDVQRLEQIIQELGEIAAGQIIGMALEQMALTLHRTVSAFQRGDPGMIVAHADKLSRLAWQMGMVTLAAVAIDVGACAERQDFTALAATVGRLERIGNHSLTELWDLRETP